jgi:four helix bundle protein
VSMVKINTKLNSYKDLVVWQESMTLVRLVYQATKQLPKSELYGLASQLQRAAVSIPSNIAEGYTRKGRAEYIQFLSMAYGSAAEVETQAIIVSDMYSDIDTKGLSDQVIIVQKMLYRLINKLKSKTT